MPSDTDNISKEYDVLLNDVKMYNPALLHKPRILGISKSDTIDAELKELLLPELPKEISYVFFSAITGEGVQDLKDLIWSTLN